MSKGISKDFDDDFDHFDKGTRKDWIWWPARPPGDPLVAPPKRIGGIGHSGPPPAWWIPCPSWNVTSETPAICETKLVSRHDDWTTGRPRCDRSLVITGKIQQIILLVQRNWYHKNRSRRSRQKASQVHGLKSGFVQILSGKLTVCYWKWP